MANNRDQTGEVRSEHRQRLLRLVRFRLDRRIQGRVDPSDVVQEACLEATARADEYCRNPEMPFFLWLRMLTTQKVAEHHRRHLGAQARDARREYPLYSGASPQATSASLAAGLLAQTTSPSGKAIRAEMQQRLWEALDQLDVLDREIIALRHFEYLTNGEAAELLSLNESTASTRYVRALKRLKKLLSNIPEFQDWAGAANRKEE